MNRFTPSTGRCRCVESRQQARRGLSPISRCNSVESASPYEEWQSRLLTKWQSIDGSLYDTKLESLRKDNNILRETVKDLKSSIDRLQARGRSVRTHSEPESGYGSSGGGGHD